MYVDVVQARRAAPSSHETLGRLSQNKNSISLICNEMLEAFNESRGVISIANLDQNLFVWVGVVRPGPARGASVAPNWVPSHPLRFCADVTRGAEVLPSVGIAPVQRSIGRHDHQVQVVHQQAAG